MAAGNPAEAASDPRVALLADVLEREAGILAREPALLASHLHNMLILDHGTQGAAGHLLEQARAALAGRPWLALTNRPRADRSRHKRVLDHPGGKVLAVAWSPGRGVLAALVDRKAEWEPILRKSNDGRWLSAVRTGQVRLWDAAAGMAAGTLPEEHSVLAWAPDRALLATGTTDNSVCVWDRSGVLRAVLGQHSEEVLALAWSPDGALLASASHDKTVRVWRPDAGGQPLVLEHDDSVTSLSWSPDGTVLASSTDRNLRLWHPGGSERPVVLDREHGGTGVLAWSPDGEVLATGNGDGSVRLWRPDVAGRPVVLTSDRGSMSSLAWSPDGARLASATRNGAVLLWRRRTSRWKRATTWEPVELFRGLYREARLTWSPDGALLASASHDGVVRLWEVDTGGPPAELEGHTAEVSSLAWSPDGALLASGAHDGTVRLWATDDGDARGTLDRHADPVTAVAWSPDGGALVSASEDQTVRQWDPVTGSCRWTKEVPQVPRTLTWSADGRWLAETGSTAPLATVTAKTEYPIRIWKRDSASPSSLKGERGEVLALAWTPEGAALATGGVGRQVKLLGLFDESLRSAQRLYAPQQPLHRGWVVSLAWSPNGLLASGDNKGILRVWDPEAAWRESFPLLAATQAHDGWTASLAWSPDGALIASAGLEDRLLRIWGVDENELVLRAELAHALSKEGAPADNLMEMNINPTEGLVAETYSRLTSHDPLGKRGIRLAWSPDGATLAVGSWEPTVRLWRRGRAAKPVVLDGHTGPIGALAWSPDGRLLASGGSDGTVRLWDAKSGKVQAAAQCLGYVMALQFSADGGTLRVADDGGATGNRPLAYVFELEGMQAGQAVSAPRAARPPRRADHVQAPLGETLSQAGLRATELAGDSFLLWPPPGRPDEAAVQAKTVEGVYTAFLTALPDPGTHLERAALHNLLRVSFEADYVKAVRLESGDLLLACVLPSALVTAEVAAGVVSGLFELGGCPATEMADADGWRRRLRACGEAQDSRIQLNEATVEVAVRGLAERQGSEVMKRRGSLVLKSWMSDLRWPDDLDLLIRPARRAVSLVLSLDKLLGEQPQAESVVGKRDLLWANSRSTTAKVGLDHSGGLNLLYQVPAVTPLLLERAQQQFESLLSKLGQGADP